LEDGDKESTGFLVRRLLFWFCQVEADPSSDKYAWLGPVFSNVTQLREGRALFLEHSSAPALMLKILPYISNPNIIRRGGAIGVVRNCCYDQSAHPYLLSLEEDIMTALCKPLIGSSQFSQEDLDTMQPSVRSLVHAKDISLSFEVDPELRKQLIESLYMLCSSEDGRKALRVHGLYPIIREEHKNETDEAAREQNEMLAEMFIRD